MLMDVSQARPDHVPPELVHDIDLYSPPGTDGGRAADVHSVWKAVQDSLPPIFWTPRNGGHWMVTRFNDMQSIVMKPTVFSNEENQIPFGVAPQMTPVNLDPPLHGKYRRLLMPWFGPQRLAMVTDKARATAVDIIERLQGQGRCEFHGDFAGVMPIVAFLTLVNMPLDDLVYLRALSNRMMTNNPEAPAAWAEMGAYVQDKIDDRRARPQDDLFSALHVAEVDGQKLTEKEKFDMCLLMIAGGLDTVVAQTCFTAEFLARNPAHRRQIIENPDRIDHSIEELFRRFGISNLARKVHEDAEVSGVQFRKGDGVVLMFPLAGLDETVNEDPMTVNFQRKNPRHLIFSTGPHTCIGNRLAKREIRIFLEEWLPRIPDFEIAPGTQPKFVTGLINHVEELNLVWDV